MCVARYKGILDSIDKEKSDSVILPPAVRRTRSTTDADSARSPSSGTPRSLSKQDRKSLDDVPLTPTDVWDGEDSPHTEVFSVSPHFVRSESQEGSVCSSLGSASDLHNTELAGFLGSEGVLHPPTVMPLTQAIDVSEQVSKGLFWCISRDQ